MFIISKVRRKISKRREIKNKEYLLNHGLIIGENVNIDFNSIDGLYPWLIEIGSNILFAPGVKILAHDASTQMHLGKAKIGRVTIGDNVTVGFGEEAENVLKPAVYAFGLATIGENSVIPDNVKIGRNTAISGVTTATNYPGGVLASGQVIKVKDGEQA